MKPELTRNKSMLWLAGLAMLVLANWAQAKPTSCSLSASGVSTAYGTLLPNVTAGSLNVTCSGTAGDTVTFYVTGVGTNTPLTRAVSGANAIIYQLYQDSGCSKPWGNTSISNEITSPTVTVPSNNTIPFYVCIAANQTGLTAGTYTDTINLAFDKTNSTGSNTNPATFNSSATAPVSIVAPATCSLSTLQTSMAFNYTSFGAAANASSTFQINCNSGWPYTLSLDTCPCTGYTGSFASPTGTYTNTATNLTYSLTLPAPSPGTGGIQTYTITGNMPAGQGGNCAASTCSVTDTHTLTITY